VGLAESGRPGGGDVLAGELIPRLSRQLQRTFHPELSRCLPGGHTAAFELLKLTRELLQDPAVPVCLVAAVDSFVNDLSLAWLEHHGRLKTLDNSDGVIPGEAGTAIIVQRAAEEQTPPASARITGLGFAFESASVLNEEPLRGLGLAAATKSALAEAAIEMHQVDFRLSDVTGESYGFKEQALALSRLMRQRREELPLWHVADSIGDSGAAAGLCHYIAAMTAFGKKYSPGSTAACFGSAVPGERAVAILQSCQSPR
jgi:3-oxoacyl-[acyl-carrier-protein] synthase-1